MAREIDRAAGRERANMSLRQAERAGRRGADGVWDIALIGAEPARAADHAHSPRPMWRSRRAIWCTRAPPLATIADVDKAGVRIAVLGKSAYDLWLERNTCPRRPWCARTPRPARMKLFTDNEADALAALRPGLQADVEHMPGARILDGRFTAVQQRWARSGKTRPAPNFCAASSRRPRPRAWSRA